MLKFWPEIRHNELLAVMPMHCQQVWIGRLGGGKGGSQDLTDLDKDLAVDLDKEIAWAWE